VKLLLDMNISPRLLGPLRKAGFEASHWMEVGNPRAPDAVVMEWARENGAVVVTHDLDFSAILAAMKGTAPSVIQVRTQDVLSEKFIGVLVAALRQLETLLENGAIIVVDENGRRARALPLK